MKQSSLDADVVRQAAQGRWPSILAALQINVPDSPKKHSACPRCGGKDRFRFDDRDGAGTFFCNGCLPHAGDGFSLVKNVLGLSFPEALQTVAGVLGLDSAQCFRPRQPLPPPPVRVDWRAKAFACELSALDRRLRAERVLTAVSTAVDGELADDARDRLMVAVCSAYDDLDQAERLEYLADALRIKDCRESSRTP